jgi:hypothetical protein
MILLDFFLDLFSPALVRKVGRKASKALKQNDFLLIAPHSNSAAPCQWAVRRPSLPSVLEKTRPASHLFSFQ